MNWWTIISTLILQRSNSQNSLTPLILRWDSLAELLSGLTSIDESSVSRGSCSGTVHESTWLHPSDHGSMHTTFAKFWTAPSDTSCKTPCRASFLLVPNQELKKTNCNLHIIFWMIQRLYRCISNLGNHLYVKSSYASYQKVQRHPIFASQLLQAGSLMRWHQHLLSHDVRCKAAMLHLLARQMWINWLLKEFTDWGPLNTMSYAWKNH